MEKRWSAEGDLKVFQETAAHRSYRTDNGLREFVEAELTQMTPTSPQDRIDVIPVVFSFHTFSTFTNGIRDPGPT